MKILIANAESERTQNRRVLAPAANLARDAGTGKRVAPALFVPCVKRGASFSDRGSFGPRGAVFFQTNHRPLPGATTPSSLRKRQLV